MLVIRPDQKAIFEERAFDSFSKQAIKHLRTELPELTVGLSDGALLDSVRTCIPIAANYGLTNWAEIMAFVDAAYLLDDERFDLDPDYWWAPEILNSPYLSSMEKAIQLLDSAFAENQLFDEE
ncbi:MAG: hypothetical protein DM484_15070 [Candidatus Methylumidiphilus alinenensis]|uniref:Uncharacterized protein n=1 Tax=Candidatus Methylumidiphilus alinenensis TaxID=2202197 RepID=A0A2W4QZ48_9GAMM|nr:MAG: hypothetical protein DM484_15070 [Candidatus Methylumidiphilus alinenensis]